MGAFGRRLVKLEVPVTDVGADGEICPSEASCSPSVPAFNPWPELPSFPYPLERSPSPSSIPAEYVLAKELFSDVLQKDVSELYSWKNLYNERVTR